MDRLLLNVLPFIPLHHSAYTGHIMMFYKAQEEYVQIISISTRGCMFIYTWLIYVPEHFSSIPPPPKLLIIPIPPRDGVMVGGLLWDRTKLRAQSYPLW